jgi:hypothetical protein
MVLVRVMLTIRKEAVQLFIIEVNMLYVLLNENNVVENVIAADDENISDVPEGYIAVEGEIIPNINDIFVDNNVVDEEGNIIDVSYRHNGLVSEE